jgi:hypothetical protein
MGHYYHADGQSCHEVPNQTRGGMRPTKITDARKLQLYPSVTTILDILDKPQLNDWKMDQCILAAHRVPLNPDPKAYCREVKREAFRQVDKAADLGTRIHEAIVQLFCGLPYDMSLHPYICPVQPLLAAQGITINLHELRLVNKAYGYAGTTDAAFSQVTPTWACQGILDFKSRKSSPGEPMAPYDGQATQIAAYHQAHYHGRWDDARSANIFISTTEPGRVEISWYDAEQLLKEWEVFHSLLTIWRIRNGYDPRTP